MEKMLHNMAFIEKLEKGMQDIEEGRGIVKSIADLEAMENEWADLYTRGLHRVS